MSELMGQSSHVCKEEGPGDQHVRPRRYQWWIWTVLRRDGPSHMPTMFRLRWPGTVETKNMPVNAEGRCRQALGLVGWIHPRPGLAVAESWDSRGRALPVRLPLRPASDGSHLFLQPPNNCAVWTDPFALLPPVYRAEPADIPPNRTRNP